MEQVLLLDSALMVIFFANHIDNGRYPEMFKAIYTSRDLEAAFAVAEAHLGADVDVSFDKAADSLEKRSLSTTCELVEAAKSINKLRLSNDIEYLIPDEFLTYLMKKIKKLEGHKRKYDELLDQAEREAQQRANTKRVGDILGRQERVRRREELKELETQLNKKNQELATVRSERRRLESSLDCQICRDERWDTTTTCGHLFCAECINIWLKENNGWREDEDGVLMLREAQCPVCRKALSEEDLKRLYI